MYEESSSATVAALQSSSAEVFNSATIASILALTTGTGDTSVGIEQVVSAGGAVTVSAGTEVVMIQGNPNGVTTLSAPNAPVVIFQGGGVNATIAGGTGTAAAGVVERVVVGTANADMIVIGDNVNTQITIGDGDTVVGGAGTDTVVAGSGDTTVQAGTGYTIVSLTGTDADYVVTTNASGNAIVTGANGETTLDGVQFVQLAGGDALVIARNEKEAAVATLYEAAFGRAADAHGLDFWFDMANAGVSLDAIADGFINSDEYQTLGTISDETFVNSVYLNTFGEAADAAELAAWTAKLADGSVDRGDVLVDVTNVVASDLADNTEVEFVGSVTIISTIV